MTREELAAAQAAAPNRDDKRRLHDGWETYRLFTTDHLRRLTPHELRAALRSLENGIGHMQALGALDSDQAQQIAWETLAELQRRRTYAANLMEKSKAPDQKRGGRA